MSAAPSTSSSTQFIKVNLEHSISSSKIPQMRYDLHQSILSVKENIERRYGSDVKFMQLILKDEKGMLISNLEEDHRTLAFYGAENGNIIYVLDLNPNSIHKEIEDLAKIEKYIISEEDYQKLPYSFRKWKKYLIKTNLGLLDNIQNPLSNAAGENDDYMKGIADCIKDKERCKLMNNGCRGTVMYVGKMSGMGYGYYVGIQLDGPYGTCNRIYKGIKYFDAEDKHAIFVRPDIIEVGDFPVLQPEDEI